MFAPFLTFATILLSVLSVQAEMTKVRRGDRHHHHHKHGHSDRIYRLKGLNATQIASIGLSGSAVNGTIIVNGTTVDEICANSTYLVGNATFGSSMNATVIQSLCGSNSSESVYSSPIPSSAYSAAAAEATTTPITGTAAEEELPYCDEDADEESTSSAFSSTATAMSSSISVAAPAQSSAVPLTTGIPPMAPSSAPATSAAVPIMANAAPTVIHSSSSPTAAAASIQTSSIPSSTSGGTTTDIAAYLKAHNDFRSKYNAKPLTWDPKLAEYAQAWGDKCSFKHSHGQYGENLAAGTGNYPIASAVKGWTDEANTYDFSAGGYNHFTQVVWKGTTAVGCSASKCTNLDAFGPNSGVATFYVCSYNPPGNYLGEFKNNVEGVTCANC